MELSAEDMKEEGGKSHGSPPQNQRQQEVATSQRLERPEGGGGVERAQKTGVIVWALKQKGKFHL